VRIQNRVYLGEMEQFLLRSPQGIELRAICLNPGLGEAGDGQDVTASFAPEDVMVLTK
jgi:hypothetical protein